MNIRDAARLAFPDDEPGLTVASGQIEGELWEIRRLGTAVYVRFEQEGFAVSTSEGYAGLFQFIDALKLVTRPVLSEAER